MKIPENIQTDFDYELNFYSFPFRDLVKSNVYLKELLLAEFGNLTAKPKETLYQQAFITQTEWEKSVTEGQKHAVVTSKIPVAASFVQLTETEKKAYRLREEFFKAIKENNLGQEYYGRFIRDTKTVRLLIELDEHLDVFKQYVLEDENVANYQTYARAAAKSLLKIIAKLPDCFQQISLIEACMAIDIQTVIMPLILVDRATEEIIRNVKKRFIILKSYADEVLQESVDAVKTAYTDRMKHPVENLNITVTDRMMRELDIILNIFKSQFYRYDTQTSISYPTLLNPDGRSGINGGYIQSMDLYSDSELFDIQAFKKEIAERYESTVNTDLLINQLTEIYQKAFEVLDFYECNLTDGNEIVESFKKKRERPSKEWFDEMEKYHAVVIVHNFYISAIYFGVDRSNFKTERRNNYDWNFNYTVYNHLLSIICNDVVDFTTKFNVVANPNIRTKKTESELLPENLFRNAIDSQACLDVMKKVLPPIIDDDGNFKLTERYKGAVVIWYDLLSRKGKTNNLTIEHRTKVINDLIPGLNINKRSFSNINQRANNKYFNQLQQLITRL